MLKILASFALLVTSFSSFAVQDSEFSTLPNVPVLRQTDTNSMARDWTRFSVKLENRHANYWLYIYGVTFSIYSDNGELLGVREFDSSVVGSHYFASISPGGSSRFQDYIFYLSGLYSSSVETTNHRVVVRPIGYYKLEGEQVGEYNQTFEFRAQ